MFVSSRGRDGAISGGPGSSNDLLLHDPAAAPGLTAPSHIQDARILSLVALGRPLLTQAENKEMGRGSNRSEVVSGRSLPLEPLGTKFFKPTGGKRERAVLEEVVEIAPVSHRGPVFMLGTWTDKKDGCIFGRDEDQEIRFKSFGGGKSLCDVHECGKELSSSDTRACMWKAALNHSLAIHSVFLCTDCRTSRGSLNFATVLEDSGSLHYSRGPLCAMVLQRTGVPHTPRPLPTKRAR